MKTKNLALVIIILSFVCINSAKSQYGSFGMTDAQSIGSANAFTASAYGTLAIGKNPAMLAFPKDTNSLICLQIPGISMQFGSNSLSIDDIANYFGSDTSRVLTSKDKSDLLSKFGDKANFYYDLGLKAIAISVYPNDAVGAFALNLTDYVAGNFALPADFAALMLKGNVKGKEFNFNDLNLQSWYIRSLGISYARDIVRFGKNSFIQNLTAGITVKMIQGFAYVGTDAMNAHFITGANNVITGSVHSTMRTAISKNFGPNYSWETNDEKASFSPMPETAGSGFGTDIGFAAEADHGLRFGLAITDIGSINWDKGLGVFKTNKDFVIDDLDSLNRTNFLNDTSYPGAAFKTSLPTALRLGVAWELNKMYESIPGNLTVMFDYHQGFNNMPSNSTTPRIALGAVWKTRPWIPALSTGISNDMGGTLRWSVGFGFYTGPLDINFATYDLISLISSGTSPAATAALNMIWRIHY